MLLAKHAPVNKNVKMLHVIYEFCIHIACFMFQALREKNLIKVEKYKEIFS